MAAVMSHCGGLKIMLKRYFYISHGGVAESFSEILQIFLCEFCLVLLWF